MDSIETHFEKIKCNFINSSGTFWFISPFVMYLHAYLTISYVLIIVHKL